MINISVVLYNNDYLQIKHLIQSVLKYDSNQIKCIYLIDNSESNILSQLSSLSDKINYIYLNQNIGYGSAHNIAIKHSIEDGVDYHVVTNPDISFDDDVLYKLKCHLDENIDVGLAMPDICYSDGTRQYLCKLLPSPLNLFARRFLPRMLTDRLDEKYNLLNYDYTKIMNVPYLSGCFMFLRMSVMKEIGLFDQRFFMYFEDTDITRRIHAKYKTIFYPEVTVYHGYNKESYKNFRLLCIHIIAAIKYFNKYGWFCDSERRLINDKFLANHKI